MRPEGTAGATPVVRAVTRRPAFHWFGYYDELAFDPDVRRVLDVGALVGLG